MINYSIESFREITVEEDKQATILNETLFHAEEDPEQAPGSEYSTVFFNKTHKHSFNVISNDEKFIGYSFIVPCNKKLMQEFLEKNISERDLLENIKTNCFWEESTAAYLCATGLKENYRRKGIGFTGIKKHIQGIENCYNKTYDLFAWIYSEEGKGLVTKLEKELQRTISKRN